MSATDCRIIVFAKAPIPGKAKTRLIPFLGASGTGNLYEQLILHSLSMAIDAHIGQVDLWCTPSIEHPFFSGCAQRLQINLFNQTGGDLGSRMAHAFHETLKRTTRALLIGTDCPSLRVDDLREAADVLRHGIDAVIGPAEDGGYILIGLRRSVPDLFTGIPWGTGSVLEQTRGRLRELRWKWHELPERWDVDRPEDVERLKLEGYLTEALKK